MSHDFNKLNKTVNIRNLLKYSWLPFFSRFGNLTQIQIEAIPKIIEGKNVVISSPTASGKTESVIAPIAEKFVLEKWDNLSVIYIVPTKALANDTYERIEGPLTEMGINLAVKHGDKNYFSNKKLPNFLITTPESLDSIICRNYKMLQNLRVLIIDEIHFLDNTFRGDQLRVLINRLEEISLYSPLSIHLLSATLSNPRNIAERYVEKFNLITVQGKKEINYQLLGSDEDILNLIKKNLWKKIICFCNKRETVEFVAQKYIKLWYPNLVLAHHGSLSKREREEAELAMREEEIAMCVSTSTLELGIDIGNIDVIILYEVPWSIISLLQRIGRGNRRNSVINVIGRYFNKDEKEILEKMFEIAINGDIPEENYTSDISVVIQQIFSCLYQYPQGISRDLLFHRVNKICQNIDHFKLILNHLENKEWIEAKYDFYYPLTKLLDLGEKGFIHSNIPDEEEFHVYDINSGRKIGSISGVFDDFFVLSGKAWKIVSIEENTIKVINCSEKAQSAIFKRRKERGKFFGLLPKELRYL